MHSQLDELHILGALVNRTTSVVTEVRKRVFSGRGVMVPDELLAKIQSFGPELAAWFSKTYVKVSSGAL